MKWEWVDLSSWTSDNRSKKQTLFWKLKTGNRSLSEPDKHSEFSTYLNESVPKIEKVLFTDLSTNISMLHGKCAVFMHKCDEINGFFFCAFVYAVPKYYLL